MSGSTAVSDQFPAHTLRFYRHAIEVLEAARIPFLVGGAYAFGWYTGIPRHTKDFDVFVRSRDARRTLRALNKAGYRSEIVFSHWLGKAYHGEDFVDVIYCSGNGMCPVDGAWFENAPDGEVFGAEVRLVPAEEMIWQKAFIMERERFDGADVIHLLKARGKELDWDRLLMRFGTNWRVLLSHLVLFGFVYPNERDAVPARVMEALTARLREQNEETAESLCQGTLLSRMQYLADTEEWGYTDPRIEPRGPMTEEQVVRWTNAGR